MTTESRGLEPRKAQVLRALVGHYVRSGEPVGSKTLVEQYDLKVSSATVRNDLAALEDAGLIYQPHTSAGRIPTDAGYRMFVDSIQSSGKLAPQEARRIRQFFSEPRWALEDALRETATLLSRMTSHAALVFAPALDRSVIRDLHLVDLSNRRVMLVVVTDTGRVENHVVLLDEDLDSVQLDDAAEMLNRIVNGTLLDDAGAAIEGALDRFPLELRGVAASVSSLLVEEMARREGERVFLEGTSNIVDEQKFADLETVRNVIGALEHRRLLLEMLAEGIAGSGVSVRIGAENPETSLASCAVVTAPYGSENHPVGSLGVVGPTRMDYGRTIAAVYEIAEQLGRLVTGPQEGQ
jgi:heat-inducible transcriptional repressor